MAGDEFFGFAKTLIDVTISISVSESFLRISNPETNTWYVKPFWRKVWGSMNGVGLGSLGATTLYGEYGQYNDQFQAGLGGLCGTFDGSSGTNIDTFCNTVSFGNTSHHAPLWTSLSLAQKCSAGALAWCRRSTQRPCMSTRGGSTRRSIST